jgi:hypothetical protein
MLDYSLCRAEWADTPVFREILCHLGKFQGPPKIVRSNANPAACIWVWHTQHHMGPPGQQPGPSCYPFVQQHSTGVGYMAMEKARVLCWVLASLFTLCML